MKAGGHVVMTFKSGFANENSAVRWVRAPGPLREAAGFSYQEFSNLEHPLALKDDPFHAGDGNKVSYWAEFLMPEHAKPLAYYDHPFFGKWPAITENQFGAGTLLYEGTYLSGALQTAVLKRALEEAGLTGPDQQEPAVGARNAWRESHGQAAALLLQLLRRRGEGELCVQCGNEPAGWKARFKERRVNTGTVGPGNYRGKIEGAGVETGEDMGRSAAGGVRESPMRAAPPHFSTIPSHCKRFKITGYLYHIQ